LLLMEQALPIALNFGIALYDCLYVALALQAKADLITADERLANAMAARFPVKWLGAL
jgi:predicted nucleic acid-binding protein